MALSKGNGDSLIQGEYVRDLDGTEQFVDACMVHRNICSAAAVSFKTKQTFKFEDIEETLSRLQKNHAQLQLTIKREPGATRAGGWNPLHWIKAPQPIPKVEFWTAPNAVIPFQWVQLRSNESWERAIMENGIQVTFEEGQLLWRAFYVDQTKSATLSGAQNQAGTFALICHSAITDQIGLHLLLDYFMEEFDAVLKGTSFKKKEAKMIQPTLDTIDEMYKKPNTWGDTFEIGFHIASCIFMSNRSIYLTRNFKPIVPDYTTRTIVFDITKEHSAKLLQQIKENGISMRGLMTASALAALHEITKNSEDELLKFWTTHEVNLRVYSTEFDKSKGRIDGCRCLYMETPLKTKSINSSDELWTLAKLAHEDIIPKLSSQLQAKLCISIANMGNPYAMFSDMGAKPMMRNDFSVAVYDDLDDVFGERDCIQIDRVFGTVSSHCLGTPFKHMVHVVNGQMFYTMLYFGNYGKYEQAREYGEKTLSYLKMAAS